MKKKIFILASLFSMFFIFTFTNISSILNAENLESNGISDIEASNFTKLRVTKDIVQGDVVIGGSGSSTSSSAPSGYLTTTKTNLSHYNNVAISSLEVNSNRWRVGLIEHYNHYNITNITKVVGVYAFFQAFDKSLLVSGNGSMSYEKDWSFSKINSNTITFSENFGTSMEMKFYGSLNMSDSSGNLGTNFNLRGYYDMSYTNTSTYTSKTESIVKYNESLKLNKESAVGLPDNYKLAIGLVGTYYLGTYQKVEKKNWWGKWSECSDKTTGNFVIANEGLMAYTYICYYGADSLGTYYYK